MALPRAEKAPDEHIGRYAIFDEIAKGGMARVHLARLTGPEGFSRVVAVKRMHPQLLEDPDFKRMFVAEARLAARVRHPNVVPILDVQAQGSELIIIMDYVHGEPLHALITTLRKTKSAIPAPVASAIMIAVLQGLHAAHEARDEKGEPLDMVHRDVSPHNVLVGADGVARVLDFGVAKAVQAHETKPESLKGKFSYMAPEVIRGVRVTRRADVFSAGVVFWELLTGQRLFAGTTDRERLVSILKGKYQSPRELDPSIDPNLERIVMKALALDPEARYPNALAMAIEIERAVPPASQRIVGDWVMGLAAETLDRRAELIHEVETSGVVATRTSVVPPASWIAPAPTADVSEVSSHGSGPAEPPTPWRARAALGIGIAFIAASGAAVAFGSGAPERTATPGLAAPPSAVSAPSSRPRVVDIDSAQAEQRRAPGTARAGASTGATEPPPSAIALEPSAGAPEPLPSAGVLEPLPSAAKSVAAEAPTAAAAPSNPSPAKFRGAPMRPRETLERTKAAHAKDFFPDDL